MQQKYSVIAFAVTEFITINYFFKTSINSEVDDLKKKMLMARL